MPDSLNFPTAADVANKLRAIGAPQNSFQEGEIAPVLAGVIADFQSPKRSGGKGGTGRQFVPAFERRMFDGLGYPDLLVPDIVPDTTLIVRFWETIIAPIYLHSDFHGGGHNRLSLPNADGAFGYYPATWTTFPIGQQNITVTATWGYAAALPDDAREAIRVETAARILEQNLQVTGALQRVQTESTRLTFDTSRTNPFTLHSLYNDTVIKYRRSDREARVMLAGIMS